MEKQKIGISADCVCDLPQKTLDEYGIELIPFHILTDSGRFCDFSEITSDNVIEYIANGHKAISLPSSIDDYHSFFKTQLMRCDRLIHINLTSGMSPAYISACTAATDFDGRVIVVDSRQLSTGMGLMIIKAAQLAKEGKSAEEIVEYLIQMRERVSTTFIAYSADYLYLNGKIKKGVANLCGFFGIHPVLAIAGNGKMKLGGFYIGNYDKSARRYIAKSLGKSADINRSLLFITHAGCSTKMLSRVKREVEKYNRTDNIEITRASATVSSNCGPNTFGVLFVRDKI